MRLRPVRPLPSPHVCEDSDRRGSSPLQSRAATPQRRIRTAVPPELRATRGSSGVPGSHGHRDPAFGCGLRPRRESAEPALRLRGVREPGGASPAVRARPHGTHRPSGAGFARVRTGPRTLRRAGLVCAAWPDLRLRAWPARGARRDITGDPASSVRRGPTSDCGLSLRREACAPRDESPQRPDSASAAQCLRRVRDLREGAPEARHRPAGATRRSVAGFVRAGRIAAAGLAVLAGLAGCASSTPGEAVRPTAVAEQRAILADRRAATRGMMDEALSKPSIADQAGEAGTTFLGFLGNAGGAALDVLSLRALGLW